MSAHRALLAERLAGAPTPPGLEYEIDGCPRHRPTAYPPAIAQHNAAIARRSTVAVQNRIALEDSIVEQVKRAYSKQAAHYAFVLSEEHKVERAIARYKRASEVVAKKKLQAEAEEIAKQCKREAKEVEVLKMREDSLRQREMRVLYGFSSRGISEPAHPQVHPTRLSPRRTSYAPRSALTARPSYEASRGWTVPAAKPTVVNLAAFTCTGLSGSPPLSPPRLAGTSPLASKPASSGRSSPQPRVLSPAPGATVGARRGGVESVVGAADSPASPASPAFDAGPRASTAPAGYARPLRLTGPRAGEVVTRRVVSGRPYTPREGVSSAR